MTAPKPANLPWRNSSTERKGWVSCNSGPVASTYSVAEAAYIVHAANAYPQLVAALRELADGGAAMGWSSADRANNLLRSLGEL